MLLEGLHAAAASRFFINLGESFNHFHAAITTPQLLTTIKAIMTSRAMGMESPTSAMDALARAEPTYVATLITVLCIGLVFFLVAVPLTFKALFFQKVRFQPKRYWRKSILTVAGPIFGLLVLAIFFLFVWLIGVTNIEKTTAGAMDNLDALMEIGPEDIIHDNFELAPTIDQLRHKFSDFHRLVLDVNSSLEKLSLQHGKARDYYVSHMPQNVRQLLNVVPHIPMPDTQSYVEDFDKLLSISIASLLSDDASRNSGLAAAKDKIAMLQMPIDIFVRVSVGLAIFICILLCSSLALIFFSNRGVRVMAHLFSYLVALMFLFLVLNMAIGGVIYSGCNQPNVGSFFDQFLDDELAMKVNFQSLLDPTVKEHELLRYWFETHRPIGADPVDIINGKIRLYYSPEELIQITPNFTSQHSELLREVRLLLRLKDWSVQLDLSSITDFMQTHRAVYLGLLRMIKTPSGKSLEQETPDLFLKLDRLFAAVQHFADDALPLPPDFGRLDPALKETLTEIYFLVCVDCLAGVNNSCIGLLSTILLLMLFLASAKWLKRRLRHRSLIWDPKLDINHQASEFI